MDYTLIRSKRRTVSIEINKDGSVLVRAPRLLPKLAIEKLLFEKQEWIEKKRAEMLKRNALKGKACEENVKLSGKDIERLKRKAAELIYPLVEEYSELIGVTYNRVTIRAQKTRWGSCSSKGNLNFNCLLALCPEPVIRYVVVHELSHRKYMNHSKQFWNEVAMSMPDYKEYRKWLKINGEELIRKL